MTRPQGNSERGVTLVELLVGMVVAGIVGAALVGGILIEAKMMEDREAWRTARQVARSASNVFANEIRMLETGGGIETASADGRNLVVRVPYAFGVLCATNGSTSTVAMLPADSVMFAAPGYSGFAWRDAAGGAYTYVASGTAPSTGASASICTGAGITPVAAQAPSPAGAIVTLSGTVPAGLTAGTVILLYRRIQYEFKASAMVPGTTGLWRTALSASSTEELAAPFETTARFAYHVVGSATAQTATPSPLSSMRGVELRADGRSERATRLAPGAPRVVRLPTTVYFQNASN